jgi:mercuric ion transport protein
LAEEFLTQSDASAARQGWFAAGGIVAALLASSCCIVPLVLVTVGVTGAWIGKFTVLEPYSPIFAAIALLCIGLGFWHVYFRGTGACATKRSVMVTKAVLWLAAVLTVIALTTDWWAPLFY